MRHWWKTIPIASPYLFEMTNYKGYQPKIFLGFSDTTMNHSHVTTSNQDLYIGILSADICELDKEISI